MHLGAGLCNVEEAEEDHETYTKLSATLVTRKDTSVATVPSIVGTEAKEEKW